MNDNGATFKQLMKDKQAAQLEKKIMPAGEIERRILRDVKMYYDTYGYPLPVDHLRRNYDYATKKLNFNSFIDFIMEMAEGDRIYFTTTPSGKRVVMLAEEAKRLEEAGTLIEFIISYDKQNGTQRARRKN